MATTKTRLDRLQARFRNSWLGVAAIVIFVVLLSVAQFGDAATKISSWLRPVPAVDLIIQEALVEPLTPGGPVWGTGTDSIYALGARVKFHLRNNLQGPGTISLSALNVEVVSFDPAGMCPFAPSGDAIYGAGPTPVNVFKVILSDGRVADVQVKLDPNEPPFRGQDPNLLELDPPYNWELTDAGKEADDPMEVRFFMRDAGAYQLRLSVRYTTLTKAREADIASLRVCRRSA